MVHTSCVCMRTYVCACFDADKKATSSLSVLPTAAFLFLRLSPSHTQRILQPYVDDLFNAIFSMPKGHPLPKAIKYLCDFLDVQAADLSQHDPDTLHTWKTNRFVASTAYMHRFPLFLLLIALLSLTVLSSFSSAPPRSEFSPLSPHDIVHTWKTNRYSSTT